MRVASILLAAGFGIAAAMPVLAQNGAMWLDDRGRTTTLQFGGPTAAAPAATDTAPADMVELFGSVCLPDTGRPQDAVAGLAAAKGLEAKPFTVAGTKKDPPIELAIWHGVGLVVSITDGFFVAPQAQCSAVFYVNNLPDRDALIAAMEVKFGAPANAADAFDKKGKPRRYFTPEWSATLDGKPFIVSAASMASSDYTPGNRVHLAARLTGNIK
ncbi:MULTISPECIES: hypothetical protein [unclassified Sphingopyxis]|uniref:hypothetical protein n=1 Tax=unclassified Sphingopyxis TaxID=2614943 RepID=UPI0028589DD2|nr:MULTISPECIES: hypothetical protein [unclassified Sphingopyxis]MDR6834346.1 hypothetical protein [Sphingopyxis sp. BE122]MDR7226615.1 hypothetical protein [Sphingopyxis sp. BE259]